MTQLVELQQVLPELRAAGYEVYAISNDPVDVLAEFANRHGITYPLLSDADSAVIRRYGILNTLVQPHEGRSMRWYGIPYPGTYVTGVDGVISHKFFHRHHASRASGRSLVHALTGAVDGAEEAPAGLVEGDEVTMEVRLLDTRMRLEVLSTLVCRLRIRRDLHLYAPGTPDGFIVTTLRVTGRGIRAYDAVWPEPDELRMELLDLTVPVWTGEVEVSMPVTATSDLVRLGHGLDTPGCAIDVELIYQACDEQECFLPSTLVHTLEVPVDVLVEPEGVKVYVERLNQP